MKSPEIRSYFRKASKKWRDANKEKYNEYMKLKMREVRAKKKENK